MRKTLLLIIIAVFSSSLMSCNNGGYKSGGKDSKRHEIIYRILNEKQVEQTEKIIVMVNSLPGKLMELVRECSVVVEVEIKNINTVAYRRVDYETRSLLLNTSWRNYQYIQR